MMHTNDHDNDSHIDWDKLLDVLDGNAAPDTLNEEEMGMLAAAREMHARQHAGRFSEDAGWDRFVAERDRRRVRRMMIVRQLVAALLVLTIGAGIWMLSPWRKQHSHQLANQLPNGKVRLKRAGGVYILGNGTQTIQQNVNAQIQSDSSSITYNKGAIQDVPANNDTLEVPKGRQFSLQLSDGTRVSLNASSTLIYPGTFNGHTREVYVTGEVFFDIAPDMQHPFIVHAGKVSMKVLGTAFNVNTSEAGVVTTLTNGKLLVTSNSASLVLLPGEQSVSASNGTLSKHTATDIRLYTAWKDGDIYFDDTPLSDIAGVLSRSYDYNFVFDDPAAAQARFTLDTRRPSHLQDVLNLISQSINDIQFKIDDKTVHVTMKHSR